MMGEDVKEILQVTCEYEMCAKIPSRSTVKGCCRPEKHNVA